MYYTSLLFEMASKMKIPVEIGVNQQYTNPGIDAQEGEYELRFSKQTNPFYQAGTWQVFVKYWSQIELVSKESEQVALLKALFAERVGDVDTAFDIFSKLSEQDRTWALSFLGSQTSGQIKERLKVLSGKMNVLKAEREYHAGNHVAYFTAMMNILVNRNNDHTFEKHYLQEGCTVERRLELIDMLRTCCEHVGNTHDAYVTDFLYLANAGVHLDEIGKTFASRISRMGSVLKRITECVCSNSFEFVVKDLKSTKASWAASKIGDCDSLMKEVLGGLTILSKVAFKILEKWSDYSPAKNKEDLKTFVVHVALMIAVMINESGDTAEEAKESAIEVLVLLHDVLGRTVSCTCENGMNLSPFLYELKSQASF